MLTKEEKLNLQNLPKVKEELEQTIEFLEQLSNSKGTISEDRYKQLENKYNTKISELKAKKEKIIDQFEEKKDELKIQQGTLQSRKQETSNNLKEITQLKGQSAISDEEYKQQSRQYNNQLREINRESSQINKDFEEIDFYFNAKGDVNFQTSKLKNKISTGTSFIKKLIPAKIINWKTLAVLILIILIPITLTINKNIGEKISIEIQRDLNSRISELKKQADDDIKLDISYSDISVNPLLSRVSISNASFSLSEISEYTTGNRWNRRTETRENYRISGNSSNITIKVPYSNIKKILNKSGFSINSFKIEFTDLQMSRYEDGDGESSYTAKNFGIDFDGVIEERMFTDNINNLLTNKQNLKITLADFKVNLDSKLKKELKDDDEYSYELFGLGNNTSQIKTLSLNIDLAKSILKISGSVETHGFNVNPDIQLLLDIDDWEESQFKDSKIVFSNLSQKAESLLQKFAQENDFESPLKDNKMTLYLSESWDEPEIVIAGVDLSEFKKKKVAKNTKIAMVTDAYGINDQSFNQSAWEGLKRAEKEFAITVGYIESTQDTDYSPNMGTLHDAGYSLILGIGWRMGDAIKENARANPEQNYAIIDYTYGEETPANVVGVVFKEQEPSFLVGYIAGKMTKTNKVGFIGGMKFPLIEKFEYGFKSGVKLANPDVKIIAKYADSFTVAAKGKALANQMYGNGADIIYHVAGGVGDGVIEAAKVHDKFAIGVDKDQNSQAPEHVITSAMKRVDNAIFNVAELLVKDGFPGGTTIEYGLKEGGVDIAPTSYKLVPAVILEEVEKLKTKIISGEIIVPYTQATYNKF